MNELHKVTSGMLKDFVLGSGVHPEDLPPSLEDEDEDVASENSMKTHLLGVPSSPRKLKQKQPQPEGDGHNRFMERAGVAGHEQQADFTFRVVVAGDGAVGKTALLSRLMTHPVDAEPLLNEKYEPTTFHGNTQNLTTDTFPNHPTPEPLILTFASRTCGTLVLQKPPLRGGVLGYGGATGPPTATLSRVSRHGYCHSWVRYV